MSLYLTVFRAYDTMFSMADSEHISNSDLTEELQKEALEKTGPSKRTFTRMDILAEEFLKCGDLEEAYIRCGYFAKDRGRKNSRLKELRGSHQFRLAVERACERMYLKALREVRDNNAPASVVTAARYTYKFFTGREPRFGMLSYATVKGESEPDQKW